jgi:hypothetical protein
VLDLRIFEWPTDIVPQAGSKSSGKIFAVSGEFFGNLGRNPTSY